MPSDRYGFGNRQAALGQAASFRGGGSAPIESSGVVPYGDLTTRLNAFMTQQAQQPYISNLPNYQAMVGQQSQNTLSQLQGEVPQDVVTQLLQRGAERGILTGSPGSANSNGSYMRALGLTSIGQQAAGAENLTRNIANTPVPEIFNPASLFVPEHLANLELNAAQSGAGGGSYGGGGISSMRLPGGQLGQGWTASPYGSVGAGAAQVGPVGALGPFDAPSNPYASWMGQYGVTPSQAGQSGGATTFNWQDPNAEQDFFDFDTSGGDWQDMYEW